MGRRGRVRADQKAAAQHREALERLWRDRLDDGSGLSSLVVAKGAATEPHHRWFAYRQGFAPGLVRAFLNKEERGAGPVLDPFCGSGTVPVECARQGVRSLGIDAVASLAFLGGARTLVPPAEPWGEGNLEELYALARSPAQRAAALFAVARTLDGEGHRRRDAVDEHGILVEQIALMRADAETALPTTPSFIHADARRLPLADGCVAGALTSPPYISRYDYVRVNDRVERLFLGGGRRKGRTRQLAASRSTAARAAPACPEPAAEEAALRLEEDGRRREASLVRGYFHDMARVLAELHRVLRPGAPAWIVVAGADVNRVYVPSDLILCEMATASGWRLQSIEVARRLRSSGRILGALRDIAPRESLIRLRAGNR